MFATRVVMLVVAAAVSAPVWAQDPDGPGRGVARVSLLNGDVSVRRGDSGDFIAAGLNQPLVVQDRLVTGIGSRAELQFDWANFLRVAGNAEVRLAELEHRRYLVQVARGTATWRVLRDADVYIEISTPSVSVRPTRKGTYRVTVHEDGSSEITVRSGEAEIFTPRGSERLRSGRTMMARGTAADPEFRVVPEIGEDDWDRWNVSRDRDLERSRSYDYISRDIYGAEDLDHHGRWVHMPSYGWVWSPRVAVGWAPYRYGRWSWVDWYGWSWVSYDPWGWAPYHYGRWFYHAPVGWCWWPGSIRVRHYWSPGLVAFVGFGGVGVGWGRVGWIPLAPWEPYHRWYGSRWYGGRSRGFYDNRVTVVNNVNITNVYRNARVDRAVTVVDHDGFRRGRSGEVWGGRSDDFRGASVARGPLPVTPERESLRVADREPTVRTAENRTSDRFFSRSRPAEVEKVSFDEQRRGVEQIARRTFGADTRSAGADTGTRSDSGTRGAQGAEPQTGWRRVGEAPGAAVSERAGATGGTRSAWASGDAGRGTDAGDTRATRSAGASSAAVGETRGTDWRSFGSSRGDGGAAGAPGAAGRGTDAGETRATRSAGADGAASSSAAVGETRGARGDSGAVGAGAAAGRSTSDVNDRRFDSRVESAGPSDGRGAVADGTRSAGDAGGRSFGSQRGSGETAAPSGVGARTPDAGEPRGTRSASDADWRRFGSPRVTEGSGPNAIDRGSTRSFGEPAASPDTDWRRFGSGSVRSDPEGSAGGWRRSTEPSGQTRDSSSGWRRDVSPGSSDSPARSNSADGWTRSPRTDSTPRVDSPSRSERNSSPDWSPRGMDTPVTGRRDWGGSRGGESIRISPPIVQERGDFGGRSGGSVRSAPSGGSFGGRGGGSFGGTRSAPSGGARSGGASGGRGGRGR